MSRERHPALTTLRIAAPFMLAAALLLISAAPLGQAQAALPTPHFTLILVYYWSIHRPELAPLPAVAALGLLQDLLWAQPPGLTALILLLVHTVLSNQQAFFARRSFLVGWAAFLPVALASGLAVWALSCAYEGRLLSPTPAVAQSMVTLLAFPLLGWCLGRLDRYIGP